MGSVAILFIAHVLGLAGIVAGLFWVGLTYAFQPSASVLALWPLPAAYAFYALIAELAGRATRYPEAIHGNRLLLVVLMILISLFLLPELREVTAF